MKQIIRYILLTSYILIMITLQIEGKGEPDDSNNIRIDSIIIRKNWRTKERIIIQELEIKPGDIVTENQIDNAISRIWNIGNFAKVNYQLDTLADDKIVLNITAQDALTLMPILSFSGNAKEYLLTLGLNDNNLMGRNISLALAGSIGTNARYANMSIGIPRQLLYRNMTLNGGFNYGAAENYIYEDGKKNSGVAYFQKNANIYIGNPYHTDYKYTFSPDLSIGYFNHKTDSSLLEQGIVNSGNYNVNYLTLATGESIGIVNHMRHQSDGYIISAGIGTGIGLGKVSPGYVSMGVSGMFAKLINRFIQVDGNLSTGYTTTDLPSLINYLGPGNVKGILSGERAGKSIFSSGLATRLTYINRDWFAIEQSFFLNFGNAANIYWDLFATKPLFSAGTGLRFMIPMVPWLAINFYYAYRGDSNHWYSVDL